MGTPKTATHFRKNFVPEFQYDYLNHKHKKNELQHMLLYFVCTCLLKNATMPFSKKLCVHTHTHARISHMVDKIWNTCNLYACNMHKDIGNQTQSVIQCVRRNFAFYTPFCLTLLLPLTTFCETWYYPFMLLSHYSYTLDYLPTVSQVTVNLISLYVCSFFYKTHKKKIKTKQNKNNRSGF